MYINARSLVPPAVVLDVSHEKKRDLHKEQEPSL